MVGSVCRKSSVVEWTIPQKTNGFIGEIMDLKHDVTNLQKELSLQQRFSKEKRLLCKLKLIQINNQSF